jgi:HEPN domain-containing protein
MKSEAINWQQLAESDYEASLYLFNGAHYPQAVYLMCQAVEKLLKAAQIGLANQTPKKNHQIKTIAALTGLPFSEEQIQVFRRLDRDYKRVRYRDIAQTSYNTKAKTKLIIEDGKAVYLWIKAQFKDH